MPTSAHTFTRANTDDSDEQRPGTDFVAAVNLHLESGQVFPATGNKWVDTLPAPATGTTIGLGSIEDETTNTAIVFYYNSAGYHRLVRYTPADNQGIGGETVLLEWAGLNLSPDLVLQGRVVGGILVYLDASGDARAVHLARAKAGVYTADYLASEPYALHLVKTPPSQAPTLTRQPATGADPRESLQIIQSKAYQFSYRWHFIDGEITPFAPYSTWLDVLTDPSAPTFASILVTLPTPVPVAVTQVDILVRETGATIWQVADTLQRTQSSAIPTSYTFYGQVLGAAPTEPETTKLYEACWPAGVLEIAGSRVFIADTLEGYVTPEPQFTAEAAVGNSEPVVRRIYKYVSSGFEPSPPDKEGEPVPDKAITYTNYFVQETGNYPDVDSTYQGVTSIKGSSPARYALQGKFYTYTQAFYESGVLDEEGRDVSYFEGNFAAADNNELATFHELSPYRVTAQFYDALGRAGGCSKPRTVFIPKQDIANMKNRSILVQLTTTDATALNAEIPAWATSYQFLVARNDRTLYFLQGRAADVLGYIGHKTIINKTNGDVDEIEQFVDALHNAHQKLRIDIGNWPASGQGYTWRPGSNAVVRYMQDEKEFVITGQYGDYLEHVWDGYPLKSVDKEGNAQARIEIYEPNTTAGQSYYERGPRLRILRTGSGSNEQRRYEQTRLRLPGDCYLVSLPFALLDRQAGYEPPNNKQYKAATDKLLIESMVPPFRLAPISSTRTVVHERQQKGAFDGFFGIRNQESVGVSSSTEAVADTANRPATNLLWLDVSWGGRGWAEVPRELQQVRRNIIRHSNQKQNGNLVNGLGSWDALNFYDKLPQEQGRVVRLSVADQAQSDGTVLLVNQEQGVTSLYLGQQPIQADPGTQLLAITDKVVGGGNALRGGYGCVDPGSVVRYAGTVFYYSRERRELVRYNKGLVPLAEEYKFRFRLEELSNRYRDARVSGCFDPSRKEYWLTFHPVDELPGTTVVWSERRQAWADAVSAVPTAGSSVNTELVTWKGSQLHRHTDTAPVGVFYGQYTPPQLTFVAASPGAGLAKTWQQVAVRSQAPWLPVELTTPDGQRSRILRPWQKFIQGVWRAAIRRDENSPGFGGDVAKALHGGRVLQAESLRVTLVCPEQDPAPLTGASVDFLVNTGQQPNQ